MATLIYLLCKYTEYVYFMDNRYCFCKDQVHHLSNQPKPLRSVLPQVRNQLQMLQLLLLRRCQLHWPRCKDLQMGQHKSLQRLLRKYLQLDRHKVLLQPLHKCLLCRLHKGLLRDRQRLLQEDLHQTLPVQVQQDLHQVLLQYQQLPMVRMISNVSIYIQCSLLFTWYTLKSARMFVVDC